METAFVTSSQGQMPLGLESQSRRHTHICWKCGHFPKFFPAATLFIGRDIWPRLILLLLWFLSEAPHGFSSEKKKQIIVAADCHNDGFRPRKKSEQISRDDYKLFADDINFPRRLFLFISARSDFPFPGDSFRFCHVSHCKVAGSRVEAWHVSIPFRRGKKSRMGWGGEVIFPPEASDMIDL